MSPHSLSLLRRGESRRPPRRSDRLVCLPKLRQGGGTAAAAARWSRRRRSRSPSGGWRTVAAGPTGRRKNRPNAGLPSRPWAMTRARPASRSAKARSFPAKRRKSRASRRWIRPARSPLAWLLVILVLFVVDADRRDHARAEHPAVARCPPRGGRTRATSISGGRSWTAARDPAAKRPARSSTLARPPS